MNEDGTMARVPQLREFCAKHGLKMISVADLIRYRLATSTMFTAGLRAASDRIRRLPHGALRERDQPGIAHGAGPRRCGGQRKRAGADAFALRLRGSVRLDPLRLPGAGARLPAADRRGRCGRAGLSHQTGLGLRTEDGTIVGHERNLAQAPTSTKSESARRSFPISACIRFAC